MRPILHKNDSDSEHTVLCIILTCSVILYSSHTESSNAKKINGIAQYVGIITMTYSYNFGLNVLKF